MRELTLGDVLFDVDRATLKPGAMKNLYRLASFLRDSRARGCSTPRKQP